MRTTRPELARFVIVMVVIVMFVLVFVLVMLFPVAVAIVAGALLHEDCMRWPGHEASPEGRHRNGNQDDAQQFAAQAHRNTSLA